MANTMLEIAEIKDIDLKDICDRFPECITKISKLKAVLKDLHPEKKREVNLLCDVHTSGIVKQIAKLDKISEGDMKRFVSIMENEFGTMPKYSVGAIYLWSNALNIECKALVVHELEPSIKSKQQVKKPIKKEVSKPKATTSSRGKKKIFQSGDVIYKDKEISITYQGYYRFDGLFAQGQRIRFVVENKTDKVMRVEGKNIVANGFVVAQGEIFNSAIDPKRKVIDTVLMYKNKLVGAGINDVRDIKELEIEFSYGHSTSSMHTTPTLRLEPCVVQG